MISYFSLFQKEIEKVQAKFNFYNSSALIAIELNVIIVGVLITFFVISQLTDPSTIKALTYGLFLMIVKNAIPIVTGIATSKKIREGILQYFERIHTVNE